MNLANFSLFVMAMAASCSIADAKSVRTPGQVSKPKKLKSVKSVSSVSTISVDSRGKKHGLFTMQGRGKDNSILLSNNIFYKPSHDHDAKNTLDWSVGDAIKVLKTKKKGTYILVNQSTGETMKGTILHWD